MINKTRKVFSLMLVCLLLLICTEIRSEEVEERNYSTDLEKIVVTASKIEQEYKHSTQNISIITKQDIEGSGITEITEILDLLPSVNILEYGSYGSTRSVHTRGASSSQTITLIDGRVVNTPRDGVTDFNQIPLSNVERIEVLRGPASNMYGAGAVGGVINIITKSGKEKMHTEILTKAGSFSTKLSSLSHGHKIDDFDYFISYDYLASKGHRDNGDYLSHNINTKLGYQLNNDNHISMSLGSYGSEAGSPGLITSPDIDDQQETLKKYIDITYNGKFIKDQNINLKLFHNFDRFEFTETFEPLDRNTHQTGIYGVDAQLSHTFFDVFRTAIGTSYQEHRLNSSSTNKHTYNLKSFNFESEVDFLDNGALKLGVRWDDYSNFGDKLSPSASFNLWMLDSIKLHGLIAKSFRAPTFNDLYWPAGAWSEGNPNLSPEEALSFETGVSGYFLNKFKTDFTFFRTNFEDLIEWIPNNAWVWIPQNTSSATVKGFELETEFALREHIKANFNYTYLESKNRDTKNWLIYRPRHLYKLRLIYSPTPRHEFGLSGIYKTKRYANATNTNFLERCFVMNSNFTYKMTDSSEFILEAKNLLGRDYQETRNYPMPGRSFYTGLRISF